MPSLDSNLIEETGLSVIQQQRTRKRKGRGQWLCDRCGEECLYRLSGVVLGGEEEEKACQSIR